MADDRVAKVKTNRADASVPKSTADLGAAANCNLRHWRLAHGCVTTVAMEASLDACRRLMKCRPFVTKAAKLQTSTKCLNRYKHSAPTRKVASGHAPRPLQFSKGKEKEKLNAMSQVANVRNVGRKNNRSGVLQDADIRDRRLASVRVVANEIPLLIGALMAAVKVRTLPL